MASKKKMARGEPFKTPECRISFAQDLFKPRTKESDDGTKREVWGCTLIFPLSAKAELEKHVAAVIKDEWKDEGLQRARNGLIKSPFLAGDGKEARNKTTGELHPGMGPDVFFIRVQSNKPVPVHYRSPTIPATQDEVFSGCYGFAVVNPFAWNNVKNGDGVSFGIEFFQKKRDGERLAGSGGIDVDQYFEAIPDEGGMSAETQGGAGAAGLFG